MPAPNPLRKSVSDIKSSLLRPALTSHYDLYLPIPSFENKGEFETYLKANGIENYGTIVQGNLQLACSEATLPGSSLATLEINNDYTGVTERHAYRRIYDDRIDLTFYVDTDYTAIRFFETWIKFIVNESVAEREDGPTGLRSPNYFYTVRYPEEYQTDFSIVKYERGYDRRLTYTFLRGYPISISSMPVSYDSSFLLKCTVSFTYKRYYIEELATQQSKIPQPDKETTQSQFGIDTTGGLSVNNALSSGNSILVVGGRSVNTQ